MKIGLIGSGFMGGVHLSAIERMPGATLTAVASRTRPTPDSPPRGNLHHLKSAALPGHVRWYPDWREMLLDPDIDAIDICLPTNLHKEVALRAFELGKHVLCEKPMALTSEDCNEMMAAADKSGRTFMVAQVLRFVFPYTYAGSFVRSVCHGSVRSCTLYRRTGYPQWSDWLAREECSGGAIVDLLSHDIDQALVLFGQPASVSAVSRGAIDTMRGTLHYADGLEVRIEGGWLAPEIPFSAGFHIASEDAALTFESGKLLLTLSGKDELVEIPQQDEYFDEMSYFVHCCENKLLPERCPPSESAQALAVANLLKASRQQDGKQLPCQR